jgi:hypothetical protein
VRVHDQRVTRLLRSAPNHYAHTTPHRLKYFENSGGFSCLISFVVSLDTVRDHGRYVPIFVIANDTASKESKNRTKRMKTGIHSIASRARQITSTPVAIVIHNCELHRFLLLSSTQSLARSCVRTKSDNAVCVQCQIVILISSPVGQISGHDALNSTRNHGA